MQLDVDTKALKKMRLPWWGAFLGVVASFLGSWAFDHFGRLDLAVPALFGIAVFGIAIAVKWKLRRHVWFWITMMAIVALHIVLVVAVPWPTSWIPAIVLVPIGAADLYLMLVIVVFVQKYMERPKAL